MARQRKQCNSNASAHTNHDGTPVLQQSSFNLRPIIAFGDQRERSSGESQTQQERNDILDYDVTCAVESSSSIVSSNEAWDGKRGATPSDSSSSISSTSKISRKIRFGVTEVIELPAVRMTSNGDRHECRNGSAVCASSQIGRRWKVSIDSFENLRQRKRTPSEFHNSVTNRRGSGWNEILLLVRDFSLPDLGKLPPQYEDTDKETRRAECSLNTTTNADECFAFSGDERLQALMARMSASDARFEERKRRLPNKRIIAKS